MTMNAESHHFFTLRLCRRAQWEIRDLARGMLIAVVQSHRAVRGGRALLPSNRALRESSPMRPPVLPGRTSG